MGPSGSLNSQDFLYILLRISIPILYALAFTMLLFMSPVFAYVKKRIGFWWGGNQTNLMLSVRSNQHQKERPLLALAC